MRVIRLRAPAGLDRLDLVHEADPPLPGPGELLVRVRACALNYRDLFVVHGKVPSTDGRVPLTDAAGDVFAAGEGVTEFKPGDAVVSTFYPWWLGGDMTPATRRDVPGDSFDGYARDCVCMPAHAFTHAPAGCSMAQAASLTCTGVTAWRALMVSGRVKPGETVLVQGSGSVSLFALQFAKAAGARVIATSSSDDKLEKLQRLGADELINYRAVPDWGRRAKDLTDGWGVDHVVEVGGPGTLAQSITACRVGGHIALVGVLTGFAAEVSIPALFSNQIRVSGISIGSRADQQDMVRAISTNRLQPVVDSCFELEDIAAAFRHYESQAQFGKVCLAL